MSKLLDWLIARPTAEATTLQDLELQLENAEAALFQAQEAEGEAQAAFDLDAGKESHALKAAAETTRARAHVDRARRLLAARQTEEAKQARAGAEARVKELESQLLAARNKAHDLHEPTAAALLKVVESYAAQLAHDAEFSALETEYARLAYGLGDRGEYHEIHKSLTSGRPSPHWGVIVRLFEDETKKLSRDSHEGRAAEEIRRSISK